MKDSLRFILPDNTLTIDMEVMTLMEFTYLNKTSTLVRKVFIPWSEENTALPAFLKRVRETQTKKSKEFLESILEPNFRPQETL